MARGLSIGSVGGRAGARGSLGRYVSVEEVNHPGYIGDDGDEAPDFPKKGLVIVGEGFEPGQGVDLGAVELVAHSMKEEDRGEGVVLGGGVFIHEVFLGVPLNWDLLV